MRKKQGIGNQGFTLLEVILSMVILGLISIPLMKYFSDSLRYAALTAQKQNATLTAQETIEFLKGQEVLIQRQAVEESNVSDRMVMVYYINDVLKNLFGEAPSPGSNPLTKEAIMGLHPAYDESTGEGFDLETGVGELIYAYQTEELPNGNQYDVRVSLKTNISANEVARPIIYGIDETRTIVAAEGNEFEDAVIYYLGAHMMALSREGGETLDVPLDPDADEDDEDEDPGATPTPTSTPAPLVELSEDEIRDGIKRTIHITVDKADANDSLLLGEDYLKIKVVYEYSCEGITQVGVAEPFVTAPLVDQSIAELESIYLMFNLLSETDDEIIIEWNADVPGSVAEAPEFVLICQNLEKEDGTFYTYDALNLKLRGSGFTSAWPWNNEENKCEIRTNVCDTSNPTDPTKNHGTVKLVELYGNPGTFDLDCKSLTTSGTSVRLVQIEVDVYKAGDLAAGKDPLAQVITTKGE